MKTRGLEIIKDYRELLKLLPELIDRSGLKDKYIFEKLGMDKGAYYRRMNNPLLWTLDELEQLLKLVERP